MINFNVERLYLLVFSAILVALYLLSQRNFLLFHSLIELFGIFVGWSIFTITWHSRKRLDNDYLLFLGIAFLFISILDVLHTLAYKGMGVFPDYDANLPTQLWIAARYLQGFSLLIAPVFLHRKLPVYGQIVAYNAISLAIITLIFLGGFPICFVEGSGLTPFKIFSEHIICILLIVSAALLVKNQQNFERQVLHWLVGSLAFMVISELAFTFYVSVYGLSNLVGHLCKLISLVLLYLIVVYRGIERPQNLLFHDLQRREQELQQALVEVQRLATMDELTGLYNRRHFYTLINQEILRSQRYHSPFSVILLDLDKFKEINDVFGHLEGDRVLQWVADCCRSTLRKVDCAARLGGDEFVILLPEADEMAASATVERLRIKISRKVLQFGGKLYPIGASLGTATISPTMMTLEALLLKADEALYRDKQRRCRSRESRYTARLTPSERHRINLKAYYPSLGE
jgi:diguanylate cyclase (GGDEF)-like protein